MALDGKDSFGRGVDEEGDGDGQGKDYPSGEQEWTVWDKVTRFDADHWKRARGFQVVGPREAGVVDDTSEKIKKRIQETDRPEAPEIR